MRAAVLIAVPSPREPPSAKKTSFFKSCPDSQSDWGKVVEGKKENGGITENLAAMKRQGARQGCWAVGPPLSLDLSRAVPGNPVVADNLRALPPAPLPPFTAALGHPVIWPTC